MQIFPHFSNNKELNKKKKENTKIDVFLQIL